MTSIMLPYRASCHGLSKLSRAVFWQSNPGREAPRLLESIQAERGKKIGFDQELRQVKAKVDDRANAMTFGSGAEPLGKFNRKWYQVGKKARDSIVQTEALAVEGKRHKVLKLEAKLAQEDKLLELRKEARLLSSNRFTKIGARVGNRFDKLWTEGSAGRLGAKARLAVLKKVTLPAEEKLLKVVSGNPEKLNVKVEAKLKQATEIAKTLQGILMESLQTNRVEMSEEEARAIAGLSAKKRKLLMEAFSGDAAKFNANWPLLFDGPNKLTADEQESLMEWCEAEVIPPNMRKAYKALTGKRAKLLAHRQVASHMERIFLPDVRDELQKGSAIMLKLGIDISHTTGNSWRERLLHLHGIHPRIAFMLCAAAQQRSGRRSPEPALRILLEGDGYAALEKKLEDIDPRSTTSLLEAGNLIIASHEAEQARIMEELAKVDRSNALNGLATAHRIDLKDHLDKIRAGGSLDETAFSIIENGLIPATIPADQRFHCAIFAAAKLMRSPDVSKTNWKNDFSQTALNALGTAP